MKEIKLLPIGDGKYRVVEAYQFGPYTIPVGFITDGASIPKFLTGILPRVGPSYTTPAVIHDYMYKKGVNKFYADFTFLLNCIRFKTNIPLSVIFYLAVSTVGWFYYL
jgi:hypothetical protein